MDAKFKKSLTNSEEIKQGLLHQYSVTWECIGENAFNSKFGDTFEKTYRRYDINQIVRDTPPDWQIRVIERIYMVDR